MAGFGGIGMVGTLGPGSNVPPAGVLKRLPARPATPGQPAPLSPEADLQRRRQQLDANFARQRSLLEPLAQGGAGPFDQAVINALNAESAGAAAGAYRTARDQISQAFGGRGLASSGGALEAMRGAQRQIGGDVARARRQVTSQAAVENYAARERALQQLQQLLGLETDYNSRFEVTGQDPLTEAFARMLGGGATGAGRAAAGPPQAQASAPRQQPGFSTGWEDFDYQAPTWRPQGVSTDGGAAADAARRAAYYASVADLPGEGRGGFASGTGLRGSASLGGGYAYSGLEPPPPSPYGQDRPFGSISVTPAGGGGPPVQAQGYVPFGQGPVSSGLGLGGWGEPLEPWTPAQFQSVLGLANPNYSRLVR